MIEAAQPAKADLDEKKLKEDDTETPRIIKHDDLRFCLLLVSLFVAVFCGGFDSYSVSTALPAITRSLGSEVSVWIGAAFRLPGVAFAPFTSGLRNCFWPSQSPAGLSTHLRNRRHSMRDGASFGRDTTIGAATLQKFASSISHLHLTLKPTNVAM